MTLWLSDLRFFKCACAVPTGYRHAFCLKHPQDLHYMSAIHKGSGETALMRRLAWEPLLVAFVISTLSSWLSMVSKTNQHMRKTYQKMTFWNLRRYNFSFSATITYPLSTFLYGVIFQFHPVFIPVVIAPDNAQFFHGKLTTVFTLSIRTPKLLIISVLKFEPVQFTTRCCV